jgi:hypothetical protein
MDLFIKRGKNRFRGQVWSVLIGPDMWVYAVIKINDYNTPSILVLKA